MIQYASSQVSLNSKRFQVGHVNEFTPERVRNVSVTSIYVANPGIGHEEYHIEGEEGIVYCCLIDILLLFLNKLCSRRIVTTLITSDFGYLVYKCTQSPR